MLIPLEYAKHFNYATGMLEGYYQNHTLQMLLVSEINRTYLRKILNRKIKDVNIIKRYNPRISADFVIRNFPKIENAVITAMTRKLNERWEPQNYNKLIELDRINNEIITDTLKSVLTNPQLLNPMINNIEPVSGAVDSGFGLTMGAFEGGYYRPQQVIENNFMNQNQPYWKPRKVEWHTNPEYVDYDVNDVHKSGIMFAGFNKNINDCKFGDTNNHWVGHKWKYQSRIPDPRAPNHVWNGGSEFPFWRRSAHSRPYARTSEGYRRRGNDSDRNLNRNRGYDMSSLRNNPSESKYPWDM